MLAFVMVPQTANSALVTRENVKSVKEWIIPQQVDALDKKSN
jgi:hypothetical protein